METFDEFKKRPKYKGLPKAVLQRRYEQYSSSYAGRTKSLVPKGKSSMHSARAQRLAQEASERDMAEHLTYKHLLRQEWYMALIDPFSDEASQAICPALEGIDVVPDATEVTVPVVADARGRALIFFRPSLQSAYAVTNVSETDPSTDSGFDKNLCQTVWNAISSNIDYPEALPWTANSFSINLMQDMPKADQFSQKYSHYAPQSAGMYFQSSEQFNEVGGMCYSTLLGGDQGVPYVNNPTFNLAEGVGSLMQAGRLIERSGSNSFGGLDRENISKLKHTKTTSVLKKLCFGKSWVPRSPRVCSDLRPTRYNPIALTQALNAVTDCYGDGANNNEWLMPPTCSTNPDVFRSFYDRLSTLNPWVNKGGSSAADGSCPADAVRHTLYGTTLSTDATATGVAGNASSIATAAQAFAKQFNYSSMDDEDAALIMLFEGCTPGATIGYVTFRINIAGLNFLRSWGTSALPRQLNSAHTQLIAAQASAGKHVRYQPTEKDPSVMSSDGDDITEKVKAGAKTVVDIASSVADAAITVGDILGDVAPVAGEIFGALSMLF